MKKKLINSVVKKLNSITEQSIGTACVFLFNQPKEPAALNKLKKNTKN